MSSGSAPAPAKNVQAEIRSGAPVRDALIFLAAALHGLLYVFCVPLWQHYDEPNHFEYVWLIADLGRRPQPGERDDLLNYHILESMLANGFFDDMAVKPALGAPGEPVELPGYSQLDESPLYYLLAAVPLRLASQADVERQLILARLVSFALLMVTVLAAWGVGREVTHQDSALRWMLPLTLALLPGFVDNMTAVNSDAAAIAISSLFFWGSVRLLRRGFSLLDFLWVCGACGLTLAAKNTAYFALPLLPVVLLFAFLRGRWRKLAWALTLVVLVLAILVVAYWGDAAYWYRATGQEAPSRATSRQAVAGEHALRLDTGAPVSPVWMPPLFQFLPVETGRAIRGSRVTLAGWMWASQPLETTTPVLRTPSGSFSQSIEVGAQPVFFAFHVDLPQDTERTWVALFERLPQGGESPVEVYYDGLVLAAGEWPLDEPPQFMDKDGKTGTWGGESFTNLLRNGSAEIAWLRIRPVVDDLSALFLPDRVRLTMVMDSFLDLATARYLYLFSAQRLLNTFWAWFGWGHIPLIGHQAGIYWLLSALTLVGLLGAVAGAIRRRRGLPWDLVWLTALAVLLSWGSALTRGIAYLTSGTYYVPVARYIYPAVVPLLLALTFGWHELFLGTARALNRWRSKRTRDPQAADRQPAAQPPGSSQRRVLRALHVGYILFFVLLDALALITILRFYGRI